MLYGMDDEENEFSEYTNSGKLNIKKVAIVSIIMLAIVILIIAVFISKHVVKTISSESKEGQLASETKNENVVDEKVSALELSNSNEISIYSSEGDNDDTIATNNVDLSVEDDSESTNEVLYATVYSDKLKGYNYYTGNHIQIASHNLSNVELSLIPKFNQNAQADIKDIYYSDEKQVYLTFDDGPTKNITPQILDILKENDVTATFFLIGQNVKRYPDLVKREYEEGHYLANHGYTHEYSKIYASADSVFQEYSETESAIRDALGMPDFNTYLFRFPGGSSGGHYADVKSEARTLLSNYGIAYTNWNALTGDAEGKETVEDCLEELEESMEDDTSVIVLMHDAADKTQTVEALPQIIQYFKERGYTFKNFYEIFK